MGRFWGNGEQSLDVQRGFDPAGGWWGRVGGDFWFGIFFWLSGRLGGFWVLLGLGFCFFFYGRAGDFFGGMGLRFLVFKLSLALLPPPSAPELREASGPPCVGTDLPIENLLFLNGQENFQEGLQPLPVKDFPNCSCAGNCPVPCQAGSPQSLLLLSIPQHSQLLLSSPINLHIPILTHCPPQK